MIKYNSNTINDWYFDTSDIIKVYRNNAVCYYKITTSGGTPSQTPCYAVVDDISQYSDTEFEDVFNKADEKWYKLNNLNQYEEYGVYGSGRNITYYEGKLTVDDETTSRLPSGYTEVEYITSEHLATNLRTGTYINTNYYPTDKTRVVIDYQATSQTAEHRRLFGAGHCCQSNIAYVLNMEQKYTASNREFTYRCGSGNTWVHTNIPFDLERHVVDFNNDGAIYIDNTQIGTRQNAPFTATYPMYLLTDNNDGTIGTNQYIVGRVYSCQMYEDGTKIRDFVPAKRDSDSKYGLYDIVNDNFYPSSSSYQFSGGTATSSSTTYEYQYSGDSWVNVGEVSGGTASLPNVPFSVNYNAKDYDATTHVITKTSGQLNDIDAVITGTTSNISDYSSDGYIRLTGSSSTPLRARVSNTNVNSYFNRTNSNPNLTVVAKILTQNSNSADDILVNRDNRYNWMYRHKPSVVTLHGSSEQGSIAVSNTIPNICSARVASNRLLTYNNWTQNTTSTYNNFNYGNTTTDGGTLFCSFATNNEYFWKGDFYWIYMSQNTLTDEQVQQVITYNESGGQTEYPVYYDEIQDPPDNLSFSSMTEAESYECPWVGMQATIDGTRYVFSGDSQSGYEWVEIISPIPSEYNELEYIEVPRVSRTTTSANLFAVPVDLQAYHKYVLDFTPVNFWDTSYYGVMLGGNDADTNFHDLGIFKLDNGWGTGKMIVSCLNYQLGRTKFNISPYIIQNTRTVISMHMNGYVANNGASISIESNGVEVFTGSSTTKANSSYNPTIGIRNVPLLDMGSSGNNTYTANLKFHNFAVMTSSDELVYNYLPVERISDGQAGLFETVNQVFYPLLGYTVTKGDPV